MKETGHSSPFQLSTCLTAMIFGTILAAAIFAVFVLTGWENREEHEESAQMTIIPAPTLTLTSVLPTATPEVTINYVSPEGFSVGAYVRIAKTDGQGLMIRPSPGTGEIPLFVASEGELFLIIDGPDEANGYVWWNVQKVSDETWNGWAAADFLELSAPPA